MSSEQNETKTETPTEQPHGIFASVSGFVKDAVEAAKEAVLGKEETPPSAPSDKTGETSTIASITEKAKELVFGEPDKTETKEEKKDEKPEAKKEEKKEEKPEAKKEEKKEETEEKKEGGVKRPEDIGLAPAAKAGGMRVHQHGDHPHVAHKDHQVGNHVSKENEKKDEKKDEEDPTAVAVKEAEKRALPTINDESKANAATYFPPQPKVDFQHQNEKATIYPKHQ